MEAKIWSVWLFLIVGCVYDLRYKRIPFLLIIIGTAAAVFWMVLEKALVGEILYAFLPGSILLLIALGSREKIGYGDGLFVLVLGLLEGGRACVEDLLLGLFAISVWGIGLLVCKKVKRDKIVPFIPFLLGAHTLRLLMGG